MGVAVHPVEKVACTRQLANSFTQAYCFTFLSDPARSIDARLVRLMPRLPVGVVCIYTVYAGVVFSIRLSVRPSLHAYRSIAFFRWITRTAVVAIVATPVNPEIRKKY